jgi:propionate CoA-transferase
MKTKVMHVSDALDLIKDGDLVALSAAGEIGWPKYVIYSLEKRYLERKSPGGLTIFSGCGQEIGRFAHPGFLKRFIASHPKTAPDLLKMAANNEMEGYVLPQGVLQQLYRCSGAKQPGLLTKIGMGTYIDPRQDGGKISGCAKEDIVRVMEIDGEEWLFYKSFPINVSLIRGTTADEFGNVTIEEEALKLEILEIALAAKATQGKVIVQVKHLAAGGNLKAKDVVIPGELVDAVVVCEDVDTYHRQTLGAVHNPGFSGEMKVPGQSAFVERSILEGSDIICRRGVYEIFPGAVVNLGAGLGAGVGSAAALEGIVKDITFTVELGAVGGTPQTMPHFPASVNPSAFLSHPAMFDFYHGGGLDITFLGVAQIDRAGNVNASKFDGVTAGQGGFIDISQSSKKVVFCTYFTAKGLKTSFEGGKLTVHQEGKIPKFVQTVDQITFNGPLAKKQGRTVVVCTERAVFELTEDGLTLTEIAPGADLDRDILAQMEFKPLISDQLKTMDPRIFIPGRMGCFD